MGEVDSMTRLDWPSFEDQLEAVDRAAHLVGFYVFFFAIETVSLT